MYVCVCKKYLPRYIMYHFLTDDNKTSFWSFHIFKMASCKSSVFYPIIQLFKDKNRADLLLSRLLWFLIIKTAWNNFFLIQGIIQRHNFSIFHHCLRFAAPYLQIVFARPQNSRRKFETIPTETVRSLALSMVSFCETLENETIVGISKAYRRNALSTLMISIGAVKYFLTYFDNATTIPVLLKQIR